MENDIGVKTLSFPRSDKKTLAVMAGVSFLFINTHMRIKFLN